MRKARTADFSLLRHLILELNEGDELIGKLESQNSHLTLAVVLDYLGSSLSLGKNL